MYKALITILLNCTLTILPASVSASQPEIKRNAQEIRLALVIGNGGYQSSPLKNPVNDAADMASALKKLGFEVIHKENSGLRAMEEAVRLFGRRLKGGGVGLFYFAGHGVQIAGKNYLIPIGARMEEETDVKFEAMDAGRVLDAMYNAANRLNIVILDACRNNPFARSFRNVSKGLARMDAPTGTIIAYATAPGKLAADGVGRNGTYTRHLLRHITAGSMKVEEFFKNVRVGVLKETNRLQTPWESSSLTGDFYFAGGSALVDKPQPTQQPPKPEPVTTSVQPSASLRSLPATLSDDDIKAMLKKHNFCDKDWNKSVDFKNDFKDNGNGTVTDRKTGLMWQQSGSDGDMKYKDTDDYVGRLNRKNLGGYSDWRLPTLEELASLLESQKMNDDLYIDPVFDKKQQFCWSSDTAKGLSGLAWGIDFSDGSRVPDEGYLDGKGHDGGSVRVVRAGQ